MVIIKLTHSWRRSLSYRNQSIGLHSKSMKCFIYDRDIRHERVKVLVMHDTLAVNINLVFWLQLSWIRNVLVSVWLINSFCLSPWQIFTKNNNNNNNNNWNSPLKFIIRKADHHFGLNVVKVVLALWLRYYYYLLTKKKKEKKEIPTQSNKLLFLVSFIQSND